MNVTTLLKDFNILFVVCVVGEKTSLYIHETHVVIGFSSIDRMHPQRKRTFLYNILYIFIELIFFEGIYD